ncbi:MAG: hypothetical protein M1814_003146 [Vezdaea aestivalis]|nr:MAG: hypothetical protein M1814_003146 [Vezdaea aestivalis]
MLPYAVSPLYDIIVNIDSYHSFMPYCTSSKTTQWSSSNDAGRRWPIRGELAFGYGGFDEHLSSRVYCVPSKFIVEALGGNATSQLSVEDRMEVDDKDNEEGQKSGSGLFSHVRTRWKLEQMDDQRTTVDLRMAYQFANPVYMALGQTVQDKVAGTMIEAFETRARRLLGGEKSL